MTDDKYIELNWKINRTPLDKLRIRMYNKSLCKKYPFLIPWNRWTGTLITDKSKPFYGGENASVKDNPKYNYEYTEWDTMPKGWRIAFGNQLLEEIREELIKCDCLDKWKIEQLKEKWGYLHLYAGTPIGKLSDDYEVFELPYNAKEKPADWNDENVYYKHVDTIDYKPTFFYGDLTKEQAEVNEKWNEEHCKDVYHKHRVIYKSQLDKIISKYTNISEHVCIHCGKPAKYVTGGWITFICEDCAKRDLEDKKSSKHYKIDDKETVDTYYEKLEDYLKEEGF